MIRLIWLGAGSTAMVLAMLGAILPLLPTTPFVLAAAFCFARSSPRLHAWLVTHRIFGPLLRDWQQRGAIAPRIKGLAIGFMVATFSLSAVTGMGAIILGIQAVVLGAASLFILTRPT